MSGLIPPDTIQELFHFKERLEKNRNDKEVILDCLYDLFDVKVTTHYLQETLIGKTVNAFRNDREVGLLAQNLVRKWKNIVIDENDGSESDSDEKEKEVEEHSDSCSAYDNDIEIISENICSHPRENDSDDKLICEENAILPQEELINLCKKSCLEIRLTRVNAKLPQILKEEVFEDREKPSPFVTKAENFCDAVVAEKERLSPSFSKIKDSEENLKAAYVDLSAFKSLNELVLQTSLARGKEYRPNCASPCKTKDVEKNICPKVR